MVEQTTRWPICSSSRDPFLLMLLVWASNPAHLSSALVPQSQLQIFDRCFSHRVCWGKTRHPSLSLQSSRLMDGNDEDNDNEDKIISSDETTSLSSSSSSSLPPLPEGEELAKQFYRQIRQRQGQQEKSTTEPDNRTAPILSEDQLRIQNAKPFSKRREMSVASSTSNSDRNVPPSQRKYTGQSDSPLFGNVPPGTRERSDPRRSMMEREFQLAGRGASLGLGVQAVFAVVVLTFYIYVGVSGGIVSGGGDYDFGGDDVIEYEQVIPVPRDLEKSVWL